MKQRRVIETEKSESWCTVVYNKWPLPRKHLISWEDSLIFIHRRVKWGWIYPSDKIRIHVWRQRESESWSFLRRMDGIHPKFVLSKRFPVHAAIEQLDLVKILIHYYCELDSFVIYVSSLLLLLSLCRWTWNLCWLQPLTRDSTLVENSPTPMCQSCTRHVEIFLSLHLSCI